MLARDASHFPAVAGAAEEEHAPEVGELALSSVKRLEMPLARKETLEPLVF